MTVGMAELSNKLVASPLSTLWKEPDIIGKSWTYGTFFEEVQEDNNMHNMYVLVPHWLLKSNNSSSDQ